MMIRNPIIPGFNPDPSIVRVGDDYYIATSSFSFFPGIPVYHSRDLVSWELSGYAFSRHSQLQLTPEHISGGLFAPTLRYHGNLFYVIVTNVTIGRTGIVTSSDPGGEWSEVHFLPELFDPDLFWDDDGRCYVAYAVFTGEKRICIRELDTEKWELKGEERRIWDGALANAVSPEAPHIYKKDGWYYLMIAEGGTEHYHSVTVARSRKLFGPYEANPANPILTHRHLSNNNPICNVGHADFVELPDGNWYAVFLGSRIYGGYHKNLGRETFIAPVTWEDEWPKIAADTGKCEFEYPAPNLPEFHAKTTPAFDDFDLPELSGQWNFIGTPVNDVYRIADSRLYLKAIAESLHPFEHKKHEGEDTDRFMTVKPHALAFVGRRQTDMSFTACCDADFYPKGSETCGIAVIQERYNGLRIEIAIINGMRVARAMKYEATYTGTECEAKPYEHKEVLGVCELREGTVKIEISAEGQNFSFRVTDTEGSKLLAENIDGRFMGSETAGGFIGAYVGMFCTGNGKDSGSEAAFESFTYISR